MAAVNAYLLFNGNCAEAFRFYQAAFGGEFSYFSQFKDMPVEEGCEPLPEDEGERVMHVSLPISKETTLMGSDSTSQSGDVVFGNNFSVSINTQSVEEADNLFQKLSESGKIIMPMTKTFWNAYFGMFTDKFGISWMINYDFPAE